MPAETSSRGEETAGAEAGAASPAAQSSGGLKPWLPLAVAVVIMPLLAFAITRFVLIPKMEKTIIARARSEASSDTSTESAAAPVETETDKTLAGKAKPTAALTKLLVNVAGTMGTRYLMTSVTLVGKTPDFKTKIEDNKDQLMDLATGVLSSKTISDLEKPSARNEIRAQLLNVFNNAFGGPVVQDIYITEMAIQ